MYVVIFNAKINKLDEEYERTASKLRELAKKKYGCTDFISIRGDEMEVAISRWKTLEDIMNWKNDPIHQNAQRLGRQKYYQAYEVQIGKIERQYSFPS